MSRFKPVIIVLGLLVQVFGKPSSSSQTVETGREARELSSGSGTGSNDWYLNSEKNPYPTKTVFLAHPGETARDSYADAASSLGYSTVDSGVGQGQGHHSGYGDYPQFGGPVGPASIFKYNLSPTNGHSYGGQSSYDNYDNSLSYRGDENGSGWLCRTFGGFCDDGQVVNSDPARDGTAPIGLGVLGLIGLAIKKFKLLPLLPLIIPLLPILLPIGFLLFVPILIASFFLPIVPVIVIGRSMSVPWARAAQEAILDENCIERITCEASRVARGYGYDAPWMKRLLEKNSQNSEWIERISRGARSTTECKKFTCKTVSSVQKALKMKSE